VNAKGRDGEDRAAEFLESSGFSIVRRNVRVPVGPRKRATLRRIAADYMQIVAPGSHFRFDVVALDGDRMTLHRNVF